MSRHAVKIKAMKRLGFLELYGCDFKLSALYMDSSSLANSFGDQNSDAFVYSAFVWRRYLLALYVCALRFL